MTVLEIGSALLLIALQQNAESHPISNKGRTVFGLNAVSEALHGSTAFLRWFGRNSYEVYLTHMLAVWPMVGLFFYFHQSIHWAPLWFLATLALAGGVGYMVARFYSEPLNHRLRTELFNVGSAAKAAAAD